MTNKTCYIITTILAIVCFIVGTYVVIKGDSSSYYALFSAGFACLFGSLYYKKKLDGENR